MIVSRMIRGTDVAVSRFADQMRVSQHGKFGALVGNDRGVAQNLRARVTQVLVFGSICQGAI